MWMVIILVLCRNLNYGDIMACGCRTKTNTKEGVNIILPYDDCIECTRKHVLTSFSIYTNFGFENGGRQQIIGELVQACYHTMYERKSMFEMIKSVRKLVSDRKECGDELLTLANYFEKEDYKKEYNSPENFLFVCDKDENTLVKAEICFSSAMQLAREVGYVGSNSFVIMGNLQIASSKFRIYDIQLSNKLREIRLKFQNMNKEAESKINEVNWDQLSVKVNQIVEKEDPEKLSKIKII